MRDRSSWHKDLMAELSPVWPRGTAGLQLSDLLDIELGLYLLHTVMPRRAATDGWTLLSGYPYGEAFGDVRGPQDRLVIRRARHYLWDRARRYTWRNSLALYREVDIRLRGFDIDDPEGTPRLLQPSRAANRFEVYQRLLTSPPPLERHQVPIAGFGEHVFQVRDQRYSAHIPTALVEGLTPLSHDLDALPPGKGAPITATWEQLTTAAAAMDDIEQRTAGKPNQWSRRLERVALFTRDETAREYVRSGELRIEQLMHMVGMVGAGKSTMRDILTYYLATDPACRRHITIVVGDVAEMLAVTAQFNRLGVPSAPVLGHSTLERNIQRLHRRAEAGAETMLAHQHPGFAYLSSACPLDALRGFEARRALRIGDAPCDRLHAETDGENTDAATIGAGAPRNTARSLTRHGCPLWYACPRHHGARELVTAQVWVATPASLVHSRVPAHLTKNTMRYAELACRRSDLIIVDEADRVQMQLDTAFAPAATLVAQGSESWLDEVGKHKLTELARQARLQLSRYDIDDWGNALNTVIAATDRIYSMLITNEPLRRWITQDYFSAMTLHQWLLNEWFPQLRGDQNSEEPLDSTDLVPLRAAMARVDQVLDRFRDNPLSPAEPSGPDDAVTALVNSLVNTATELLHAQRGETARRYLRDRLKTLIGELVPGDGPVLGAGDSNVDRFEFTLVLAVLHNRLNFVTTLWPRVEAALNLESTSNVLSRRPPKDYMPIVPESPMGNVLGFQFQAGDRNADGEQSGELRFFRCNGVGRELLLELTSIPAIDDRPGPNVLLMSATSWAGTSSRYHLHATVDAILRPHDHEIAAINDSQFRTEFLYRSDSTEALRLSGVDPQRRPQQLEQMLHALAVPDRSLAGATSLLQQELDDITDPQRRRILLLVGSYAEAAHAGNYLNSQPEWAGNVTVLVADDTDLDHSWSTLSAQHGRRYLRRGEITTFPDSGGQLLIAPLLAVERGHNIVIPGGKAAIGSVYFLARPHHRPDDITLATQAINDWAVRQYRGAGRHFHQLVLAQGTPDAAGVRFRQEASRKWHRYLTRRLSWTSLPREEKSSFTWDQLVVIWQVIGRLVRGGVAARVYFVDGAFSPREAGFKGADTPETSLLRSMIHELEPYFEPASNVDPLDRSLVRALYQPLYDALRAMG
ncbi:signal recognition particle [Micromonospora chersina]|uniref:pPIWI_RE_Z domain-containing protein n=1 Tax=Micromonospora chersina TaxID=47854 RepID=UPI0034521FA9